MQFNIIELILFFIIFCNIFIYAYILRKKCYVLNIILFLESVTWFSCLYHYCGGKTYGEFDLEVILFTSFIWFISSVLLLGYSHILEGPKFAVKLPNIINFNHYQILIYTLLIIWIYLNYENLLLYQLITGTNMVRLDAIETQVEGYYTYYSIVMFNLSYVIYFNFYCTKFKKIPLVHILVFAFFGFIAGNKSCVVFFVIFILIIYLTNNGLKLKSIFYLIFFGLFLLSSYFFIKESNYLSIIELLHSSIRRLFITQSSSMILRFDLFLNDNINTGIIDLRELSREVYSRVYPGEGSMPSPIWGDMILQFNLFGIIISIFFISIVYGVIKICLILDRLDLVIIPFMLLWLLQQAGINQMQLIRFTYGFFSLFTILLFVKPTRIKYDK